MPNGDNQNIRFRLRSYERKLQKEKKEHGFYRDGAGASSTGRCNTLSETHNVA